MIWLLFILKSYCCYWRKHALPKFYAPLRFAAYSRQFAQKMWRTEVQNTSPTYSTPSQMLESSRMAIGAIIGAPGLRMQSIKCMFCIKMHAMPLSSIFLKGWALTQPTDRKKLVKHPARWHNDASGVFPDLLYRRTKAHTGEAVHSPRTERNTNY